VTQSEAMIGNSASRSDPRNQQMVVISQLMRHIGAMQSVDELFRWLALMLVQRLEGEAALFWTKQANQAGNVSLELRTTMCKDTVPRFLLTNHQVVRLAEHMMSRQRGHWLYSVHTLFSPYQAMMLDRYGFRYCCGYYLEENVLLPPANDTNSYHKVATPLRMAVLLFLREAPRDGLMPGIGYILEQALQLARYRGILQPAPESEKLPAIMLSPQGQRSPASPLDFVPQRSENTGLMKVSNPLAPTLMIASKPARRFYQAIDGQMTIRELMLVTLLNEEETYAALRTLLQAHRIIMYKPGGDGKSVDSEQFLDSI
jgi:hypothetical protein